MHESILPLISMSCAVLHQRPNDSWNILICHHDAANDMKAVPNTTSSIARHLADAGMKLGIPHGLRSHLAKNYYIAI
jgi:hypothetical protein